MIVPLLAGLAAVNVVMGSVSLLSGLEICHHLLTGRELTHSLIIMEKTSLLGSGKAEQSFSP